MLGLHGRALLSMWHVAKQAFGQICSTCILLKAFQCSLFCGVDKARKAIGKGSWPSTRAVNSFREINARTSYFKPGSLSLVCRRPQGLAAARWRLADRQTN